MTFALLKEWFRLGRIRTDFIGISSIYLSSHGSYPTIQQVFAPRPGAGIYFPDHHAWPDRRGPDVFKKVPWFVEGGAAGSFGPGHNFLHTCA